MQDYNQATQIMNPDVCLGLHSLLYSEPTAMNHEKRHGKSTANPVTSTTSESAWL
jgi:hypothetical protein